MSVKDDIVPYCYNAFNRSTCYASGLSTLLVKPSKVTQGQRKCHGLTERLRFPERDSQTDEQNPYINYSTAEHEHQFSDAVQSTMHTLSTVCEWNSAGAKGGGQQRHVDCGLDAIFMPHHGCHTRAGLPAV